MGFIDNAIKALRLLGGRRYTNDSLGTAKEAFNISLLKYFVLILLFIKKFLFLNKS